MQYFPAGRLERKANAERKNVQQGGEMKKICTRGGMIVVTTIMSLAFLVQDAGAIVAFPQVAQAYRTYFARAYDQCVPSADGPGPTVTVVAQVPSVPSVACLAQNSATDTVLTMRYALLLVNNRGRVGLFGTGFPFGGRVKVQLNLRVTRKVTNVKHPPSANAKVTFVDLTITCPTTAFGFPVRPSGGVVGTTTLASCLGGNSGLAGVGGSPANIEILGAQIINVDTGLPLATSGIVR